MKKMQVERAKVEKRRKRKTNYQKKKLKNPMTIPMEQRLVM